MHQAVPSPSPAKEATAPPWPGGWQVRQSQELARRVEQLENDPPRRIDAAFMRVLGRLPTSAERAALAARHGLAQACRVMFNTNEFIFVD